MALGKPRNPPSLPDLNFDWVIQSNNRMGRAKNTNKKGSAKTGENTNRYPDKGKIRKDNKAAIKRFNGLGIKRNIQFISYILFP